MESDSRCNGTAHSRRAFLQVGVAGSAARLLSSQSGLVRRSADTTGIMVLQRHYE